MRQSSDVGATKNDSLEMDGHYRQIQQGALRQDREAIAPAAMALDYFDQSIPEKHREVVRGMFIAACEPLRFGDMYDFGTSDLAAWLRDAVTALGMGRDFQYTPLVDVLLLHRTIEGLYFLEARLKVRVDIGKCFPGKR